MGPHNLVSLTRWTIKWNMVSKKEGWKCISNWHKIYSWTYTKLIKTRMRDKDKINRRSTQPFYTGSLSITREANPVI